ncbi:MAG: ABC transporter ATP-binding protein [Candidatus Moranbacteria bacterium]|nr:ABC transporter ATP-binding protein [Candidatus Moranbacteria bacterium]MBP6034064.1 ABC transporter ATP-binding protein [Candidatus Moranbacteria bacterium]MBP7695816.1 ABC transporter ATP-binding protein [Candidatus Moranbacteria bacterium]
MSEPIIVVDKLRIIYNQGKSNEMRALEETSVSIYPHEYVIIFGPSGCGKSTLLYSLSGLQSATYGSVSVKNKVIAQMTEKEDLELHQTFIGMIFQAFYLIPSLNIIDNVILPKVFRGEPPKERLEAGYQLLRRFGIAEQADKFPSQLSGGQKQRVAIARSLVNNPDIILADEPVGNLDSESAENVLKILKELNEVDQKTVVMVTHNPEHLQYADRVLHMKDGRIIKEEVHREKRAIVHHKRDDDEPEPEENKELKMLMASFRSLLPQQVDVLLVPFKAKQLLAHLLSELNEEQISMAEAFLKELLFKNIDNPTFTDRLDLDLEKGGAGWNRLRAESFSGRVQEILAIAQKLKDDPAKSATLLAEYLITHFHLKLDQQKLLRLQTVLKMRLESTIGQIELRKRIDAPVAQDGVGLHKNTVEKVAREVEVIMLLKFS